mmetsp:Transcript_88695/g.177345  ORF Transcript_88695/g.177345 Transcript_88695/m.177345 type:complete len:345 (+) Transcript_88695:58-1092(+)
MYLRLARSGTVLGAAAVSSYGLRRNDATCASYTGGKISKLREEEFPLTIHHHGKAKVRVLKVRHNSDGGVEGGEKHSVSEFTVHTKLFSPEYAKVFTGEDNDSLVATDTQKNTVYVIAKRTAAESPEQFGLDLAKHFLRTYPVLTAAEVEVEECLWERASVDGQPHDHAFTKVSPERACAVVRLARGAEELPHVKSSIRGMTVLKTTQSGFSDYLKDSYTLLPDTDDRCLATELSAEWTFNGRCVDYSKARAEVRAKLLKGIFGPSHQGVFSVSLQATIYDAACLALSAVPELESINISTPNIHYLPTGQLLERLKVVKPGETVRDVFIPTSEPSGTIFCEVKR